MVKSVSKQMHQEEGAAPLKTTGIGKRFMYLYLALIGLSAEAPRIK